MSKDESPLSGQETITLTKEQFESLKSGNSETRQLVEALVAGLKDINKPYKDPRQEANEAAMRESMKQQKESQDRFQKVSQSLCPHKMASNPLSSTPDMFGRAAFWHHRLDTGEEILICSNCQLIVRQTDPEFARFASMPTTNQPSAAGQRFFADPLAAIRAGQ